VGSCAAEISEEEYLAGLRVCGAQSCTMQGHEFAERIKCSDCAKVFKSGEDHQH